MVRLPDGHLDGSRVGGKLVREELTIDLEESADGDRRQYPGEPASQSRPDPNVPGKKPADTPREQSRKLSCQERKQLDGMPGRMEQRESTAEDRHAVQVEPSFYRQVHDGIGGAGKRLAGLKRDLTATRGRCHALEGLAG